MAKNKKPFTRSGAAPMPVLAWRTNRISEHREAKGMTQQDMADALAERGVKLTRNSIGRIEQGKQRPFHDVLAAMAQILETDVDSMLDLSPDEAQPIRQFRSLQTKEQRKALRLLEVGDDD